MKVLVVIFGGVDRLFLERWSCPNLVQAEWGRVVVDQLHDRRDVASQITAQLITGRTWRDNGVGDRKRQFVHYRRSWLRRLEEGPLAGVTKGLGRRRALYHAMGWVDLVEREYLRQDLACPSLFDRVPGSRAVYVPAWNPEPTWALDRNILDPRRYPDLGVEAAEDLLEKHLAWRTTRFMAALRQEPVPLLMGQFQFIDSAQHLYLDYVSPPDDAAVQRCYARVDALAGEIKDLARGRYDRVLFLSDNGAARKNGYRPTHHNRPFYSVDAELELGTPNMRDFHDLILGWVAEPAEHPEAQHAPEH